LKSVLSKRHSSRRLERAGVVTWIEGAAARKCWYRLFDIPDAVVKQFGAERRRSAKVVQRSW
jgi:hypothetical protein